jgi:thioester reductase-like protein
MLLSEEELKAFLRKELPAIAPARTADDFTDEADFFSLGMDSLQASQLRSVLVKSLDTKGHKLGLNVVFEHPSIASLSRYLYSLTSKTLETTASIEEQMEALISKYSDFEQHVPRPNGLSGRYIVVTGATGSLGCHVVAKLSALPDVQKIYCFVRANSTLDAYGRLLGSLRARRVYDTLSTSAKNKLIALPSDLALPTLGLDTKTYNTLTSTITDIIHCAWSVNFNLHLSSFEKDNIAGIRHLANLCLKAQRPAPATLNFCSSISAVVRSPEPSIPEALPSSLAHAQAMGYAQSKLVAEHLCVKAYQQTGLRARVLRIGQVIGDTENGIWNTTEAIPLMIQSAMTIGALPKLDEFHRWLPVNTVAGVIADIALSESDVNGPKGAQAIYNIISPYPFHWTTDLLPCLRYAGLDFEELDTRAWLKRLRESSPDPVTNPPIKLVDFWTGKYDHDFPPRVVGWETEKTKAVSRTFGEAKELQRDIVRKMTGYFLGVDGWGKGKGKLT